MSDFRYVKVRKVENGYILETHSTLDYEYGYASIEEVCAKIKVFYQ